MTASAVDPVPSPTTIPGVTRSAATTAKRCRRSARSTSGNLAMKSCAGILVDEPQELAVRQGGPDQLRREGRGQLRALQYCLQRIGFAGATDEEKDLATGVDNRRREGEPGRVHLRHEVGDGEILVLRKGVGIGKEGGCVSIIPHPEQHEVETRGAACFVECFAQKGFVRRRRFPR